MPERKRSVPAFLIRVIDGLKLGVPLRNFYHELKYRRNIRAVAKNRRFKKNRKPGQMPFPPPRLIYRVAGHFSVEQFNDTGRWAAAFIRDTLSKNGLDIRDFPAILDFGCGCGRVFRHWADLHRPRLCGCDYQRPLVNWCRRNLAFGRFERNGLRTPLGFPAQTFGFIYAISVFTHLDQDGQMFWIGELDRVLQNQGALLLTVHGTTRLAELSTEELRRFQEGLPIIRQERYSGANLCATYHPPHYVRDVLCGRFKLLDFLPGGARDANQDVYLFRKA